MQNLFIYLFTCQRSKMTVLFVFYHSIILCTSKGGTMLVLFVIFGGLFRLIDTQIDLHKFRATLVVYPLTLSFICFFTFTVRDSEIVDCGHVHNLQLSSFSFRFTLISCCKRRRNEHWKEQNCQLKEIICIWNIFMCF